TVRCPCGRSLARVCAGAAGPVAVIGSQRLPPRQALDIVIDAALRDVENAAEAEDQATLDVLDDFLAALDRPAAETRLTAALPSLTMPGLGPWRLTPSPPAGRLTGMAATCGKC